MKLKLAGCVILDDERRILLLHRNKNGQVQWELPGGKVDQGESEQETAIRELYEELGVEVEIVKELGTATFSYDETECEYVWFEAKIVSGTPQVCEPQTFDDVRYFAQEELNTLQLSSNMQNLANAIGRGDVVL